MFIIYSNLLLKRKKVNQFIETSQALAVVCVSIFYIGNWYR